MRPVKTSYAACSRAFGCPPPPFRVPNTCHHTASESPRGPAAVPPANDHHGVVVPPAHAVVPPWILRVQSTCFPIAAPETSQERPATTRRAYEPARHASDRLRYARWQPPACLWQAPRDSLQNLCVLAGAVTNCSNHKVQEPTSVTNLSRATRISTTVSRYRPDTLYRIS